MDLLTSIIPPRAKTVVEFGGDCSVNFSAVQPRVNYSIEKFFGNEQVDCILYHDDFFLQQPNKIEKQMKEHLQFLRDDGQIAIYLPNPGHIDQLISQIQGKSNPIGIGLIVIAQILNRLNLSVYIQPIASNRDQQRINDPNASNFIKSLLEINQDINILASKAFCIYATKLPHPKLMVQCLLGETLVTSRPRISEPNSFIRTVPNTIIFEQTTMDSNFIYHKDRTAKILIRQRCRYTDFFSPIRQLEIVLKSGYTLVNEQDDWISVWMKEYAKYHFIDFTGVHAVQTSTDFLRDKFFEMNSEVNRFANQIKELPPPRDYDVEDQANPNKTVRILYAALNRWKDCKEIIPALNELCAKYTNVQIDVAADEKFYNALTTDRKKYLTHQATGKLWIPYDYYLQMMRQSDIIIMPLKDNEFNVGKSDIKFIEAASQGCATIASNTVYDKTIIDGKNGFMYRNPEEFKAKLEILITNPQKRREMAKSAYEYVKNERMLADHYMDRVNWYWSLHNRRTDLTIDLFKRLERDVPHKYLEGMYKDFPSLFSKNFDLNDNNEEEMIISEESAKSGGDLVYEYFSGGDDL